MNSPIDAATQPESEPGPNKSLWNSLLPTLPIVLTILATAFAGMSSSEMTQAMYYRSLAAQHQSKAGDQWAFFQAKRIRGTNLEMTSELLQSLTRPGAFDSAELNRWVGSIEVKGKEPLAIAEARSQLMSLEADQTARRYLTTILEGKLPPFAAVPHPDQAIRDRLDVATHGISHHMPDAEIADMIRKLKPEEIEQATRLAEQNADAFDQAIEPLTLVIDRYRAIFKLLSRYFEQGTPLAKIENAFRVAVLDFDARRYRQESTFNRKTAELYEVRVRRSGLESDRHRERSKMFFYSMLVAQVGVTIASLALARTQRRSLWLFAALAGMIAVALSTYVYVSL